MPLGESVITDNYLVFIDYNQSQVSQGGDSVANRKTQQKCAQHHMACSHGAL
jgi:hypothetical protein